MLSIEIRLQLMKYWLQWRRTTWFEVNFGHENFFFLFELKTLIRQALYDAIELFIVINEYSRIAYTATRNFITSARLFTIYRRAAAASAAIAVAIGYSFAAVIQAILELFY